MMTESEMWNYDGGNPDGVLDGPCSLTVKDPNTGNVYIKQSPLGIKTGWKQFQIGAETGGNGGLSGNGSPEGVVTASPGTPYIDVANEDFYVKKTGTGNTGWLLLSSAD